MTRVTVQWNGAAIEGLSMKGHAGFAEKGHDIVCVAVSVLMTTCINALETVAGTQPQVTVDEKVPLMAFSLSRNLDGQEAHDAQIILRTALQGIKDISEEYPKHLKLIDGRKSSC